MTSDYQKNKEYYIDYQKTSPRAKEARERYYQKNRKAYQKYHKEYRERPESRAKYVLAAIRHRAKKNNMDFDLVLEDIYPFPDKCPVLGIPLDSSGGRNNPNSPSVDRIDNTKGYTKDNICVISLRANILKSNGTTEEFKKIIEYMQIYRL